MNIIEALNQMKSGDGDIIIRTGEPIGICKGKGDWPEFGKHTPYLDIDDIVADDWRILYSAERE